MTEITMKKIKELYWFWKQEHKVDFFKPSGGIVHETFNDAAKSFATYVSTYCSKQQIEDMLQQRDTKIKAHHLAWSIPLILGLKDVHTEAVNQIAKILVGLPPEIENLLQLIGFVIGFIGLIVLIEGYIVPQITFELRWGSQALRKRALRIITESEKLPEAANTQTPPQMSAKQKWQEFCKLIMQIVCWVLHVPFYVAAVATQLSIVLLAVMVPLSHWLATPMHIMRCHILCIQAINIGFALYHLSQRCNKVSYGIFGRKHNQSQSSDPTQ